MLEIGFWLEQKRKAFKPPKAGVGATEKARRKAGHMKISNRLIRGRQCFESLSVGPGMVTSSVLDVE